MNPLLQLHSLGQSVWLDYIHRGMLRSGRLAAMIGDDGVRGLTSNPTIFEKAIGGSTDYDAQLVALLERNLHSSSRELFYELAIDDIRAAADLLRPVYTESGGKDGMVSLEVSPDLAYDTAKTVAEARRLHSRVDRPNLMIKVPATPAGLPAIETLIGDGINVNVTLLFSVQRYSDVVDAYLRGLETRLQRGLEISGIASVASFFVSRVDAEVDKRLTAAMESEASPEERQRLGALLGKAAIANAKAAYRTYKESFSSQRFQRLRDAGAQTQRLLWASTGTKNPDYSDVLYVDSLIGPDTVNTMPPATLDAFKDHGTAAATLEQDPAGAHMTLTLLQDKGIDLAVITDQLEHQGVQLFADSFTNLLQAIDKKSQALADGAPA